MFALRLDSNFHAKKAASAAYAFWITLTVLYGLALLGCCSRKVFFFAFYSSRIVIVICLSIMLHHMGQMLVKVNYGLNKISFYEKAIENNCMDDYSRINDVTIKSDLTEAWRHCVNSIVFTVVVLTLTVSEMCCGISCLPLIKPSDFMTNVKAIVKQEWYEFLIIGYYRFN